MNKADTRTPTPDGQTHRSTSAAHTQWTAGTITLCLTALISWMQLVDAPTPASTPMVHAHQLPWPGALLDGALQPGRSVLSPADTSRTTFAPKSTCPEHRTNQVAALSRLDGMVVWPGKPVSLVADVVLPMRPEFGFCIGPMASGAAACLGAGAADIMPAVEKLAKNAGLRVTRQPLSARSGLLLPFSEDLIIEAPDRTVYYLAVSASDQGSELAVSSQPLGPDADLALPGAHGATAGIIESRVTIGMVGDIMPAGSVGRILDGGVPTQLQGVGRLLSSADIALANLEAPVTTARAATSLKTPAELRARREFVFKADPQPALTLLKTLGIDAVSLANNHILDYQAQGLADTTGHLRTAGIASTGAGSAREARRPALPTSRSLSCGLLSYAATETLPRPSTFEARSETPGVALIHYDAGGPVTSTRQMLAADIKALRETVDIVVVALHWGTEGSAVLRPGQRELAHFCIEQGADVIWGHHPHRLQPIELYRGKLIAYSMGNFVFNSPPHRHLLRSGVLIVCFDTRSLVAASLIPASVGSPPGTFGNNMPGMPRAPVHNPELTSELLHDLGFAQK